MEHLQTRNKGAKVKQKKKVLRCGFGLTYTTMISCLTGKFKKKKKWKKQFVSQISIDESIFHQMATVA